MRSCLSWSESAQQLRGHQQSGRHVACAREWHACAREWHACAAAAPQRQSVMHVILQRRSECRSLPLYLSISLSLYLSISADEWQEQPRLASWWHGGMPSRVAPWTSGMHAGFRVRGALDDVCSRRLLLCSNASAFDYPASLCPPACCWLSAW